MDSDPLRTVLPASKHRQRAFGCGIVATTIAGTALVGWILEVNALKGFGGAITLKANAAVGLIASGAALSLLAHRQ